MVKNRLLTILIVVSAPLGCGDPSVINGFVNRDAPLTPVISLTLANRVANPIEFDTPAGCEVRSPHVTSIAHPSYPAKFVFSVLPLGEPSNGLYHRLGAATTVFGYEVDVSGEQIFDLDNGGYTSPVQLENTVESWPGACEVHLRLTGSRQARFYVSGTASLELAANDETARRCDSTSDESECFLWVPVGIDVVEGTITAPGNQDVADWDSRSIRCSPTFSNRRMVDGDTVVDVTFALDERPDDLTCGIAVGPSPVDMMLNVRPGNTVEYSVGSRPGRDCTRSCIVTAPGGEGVIFVASPIEGLEPVWDGDCSPNPSDPWRSSITAAAQGAECTFRTQPTVQDCDEFRVGIGLSGSNSPAPIPLLENAYQLSRAAGTHIVDIEATGPTRGTPTYEWSHGLRRNELTAFGDAGALQSSVELDCPDREICYLAVQVTDECGVRNTLVGYTVNEN